MADDPRRDESRFQWLRNYWQGQEETSTTRTSGDTTARRWPRLDLRPPTTAQFQQLPQVLSFRERLVLRIALALIVLSIGTLIVRWWQRHTDYVAKEGGTYTEGLVGAPQFLNPLLSLTNDVDTDLARLIFRGLYQANASGSVERALATHEEVSADGLTYLITMRSDATWHDGQPVTANDVAFTFNRILDPESQSPALKVFKDIRIEAVNDATVQFTLTKPYAPFLSTLTIGIVPEHIWSDIPPANSNLTEYNLKPIGAGPYRFDQLTKDRLGNIKSYKLVRYPDYYGPKPNIGVITFRFYPDTETAVEALRQKRVQGLNFVTSDMRASVEHSGVAFRALRLPQYTALFINQRNALLKDVAIREALERAVDRSAIIREALKGNGEVTHTPILPGFLGYNAGIQGLALDSEAARRQLERAGWKLPEGGSIRTKNGQELRFSISTVDREEYMKTAEMLRAAWESVGVAVEIRLYSSTDIIKKVIKPREYETLLFSEIVGADPDPYPFWHSSQAFDPGLNLTLYANKEVDTLLEEARQTNDAEQRRQKYEQFQGLLAKDMPAIFLFNPLYTYAPAKKLKGFTTDRITTPADRFNDIEHWYIKTRRVWK